MTIEYIDKSINTIIRSTGNTPEPGGDCAMEQM